MRKRRRQKTKTTNVPSFDDLCREIDDIVKSLATEITSYDAISLLHRAFWSTAYLHLHPTSKQHSESGQYLSVRTLEFIQSNIASLNPSKTELPDVDDNGWKKIEELVQQFSDHVVPFFILRSKELENQSEAYEFERDALLTQDIMHWWMIRGHRYSVHELIHIRDLLLPFSDIFQELFDISMNAFLREMENIYHSLTLGIGEAIYDLIKFKDVSPEKTKEIDFTKPIPKDKNKPPFREAIESVGLGQKADEVFDRVFGLGICNLTKITKLPIALLDELSWREGQDKEFWAEGEYAGWPLRVTPIRKRPFLHIQDQYYCFDLLNLFDNLYHMVEKLVLSKRPVYRETWNRIQKENSEALPFKYFNELLPNATVYRSIYYGKKGSRSEVDGLIIYDDVLLILEVKAGALDTGSPIMDYETHLRKLQELIDNPATQTKKFREYLEIDKQIKIFEGNDKRSQAITTLRANSFRKIFQCTITIDNLTHLTAKANKLKPIGIDVHTPANLSLTVDDLRVYTDLFDSPLQFLHFLEQRELAENSELIELNDELDHLGFYLLNNNYALTADELVNGRKKPDWVAWDSFTEEIDKYYSKLLVESNIEHEKPNQKMPGRIKEIIQVLETQEKPGRARAASNILDGSGEYRQQIEDGINFVLGRQKEAGRINPFHIHGDMNVSVFCEQEGIKLPDRRWVKDYIISMLIEYKKDQSLVLFLKFTQKDKLIDANFAFISIADTIPSELARIEQETSQIKSRLSRYDVDVRKLRK